MGKFDNILLCTDLDDTLLTTDKKVSAENQKAIEYFQTEGGIFTFATGRMPHGARLALDFVTPNAPIVCYNGAGIFDLNKNNMIWKTSLDKDSIEVVEMVEKEFNFAGIEICGEDNVYFSRMNRIVYEHKAIERFPDNFVDYHDVTEPWIKVLFMQEKEEVAQLREFIAGSRFADKYEFIQSSPYYYELLPKNATKGNAALQLADILRIPHERVIGVGDNENDLSLVKQVGVGIAVSNAVNAIKDVADYITVDNNSHAISAVISALANGIISIND